MPKYRLSVQIDFTIEVDPAIEQETTPNQIRHFAWRRLLTKRKEDWQSPGVRVGWRTSSFSPTSSEVAEVVEVTPAMEVNPTLTPCWKLERVAKDAAPSNS